VTLDEVIQQLRAKGYSVSEIPLPGVAGGRVLVLEKYAFDVGPLKGLTADVGIHFQPDFPLTGPTGFDTNPAVRPGNGNNAIHAPRIWPPGAYWSRPFPEWNASSKDVAAILAWFHRAVMNAPPN
jgi:hypothetical protein